MVKHCIEKLSLAKEIRSELVKRLNDGKYVVQKSCNSQAYNLHFGNAKTLPFCECFEWKRTKLPCKHIFAVIENGFETWESLHDNYIGSPYYNLDQHVIPGLKQDFAKPVTEESPFIHETQAIEETYFAIPKQTFPKKTKSSHCRELLGEIKSLTYLCYDNDAIEDLEDQLINIRDELKKSVPEDEGLVVEDSKEVFNFLPKMRFKEEDFSTLPKSNKKKHSRRVGAGAKRKREAGKVEVESKENKPNVIIIEEGIDLKDQANYDIPFVSPEEEISNICEDVVIVKECKPSQKIEKPVRRNLKFSEEERETILEGQMISDESINLAQNLLHEQFPGIDGFFDTTLALSNSFEIVKKWKPFIQILHTGSHHWVCVANMTPDRQENNKCILYDSLNSGTFNSTVASYICALSYCKSKVLDVQIEQVQQQSNFVDCGLFAIAFATSLAFSENPGLVCYEEGVLRHHLVECLEKNYMEPFPKLPIAHSLRCRKKHSSIEVFCSCRMPYISEAKDDPNQDMVECENCFEWYHRVCENIPAKVFESCSRVKWFCSSCC